MKLTTLLLGSLFLAGSLTAQEAISWLPGETAAQRDARMAWWREARFGIFVHWGVYAVPGGVYKGQVDPQPGGEWLMQHMPIPVGEYRAFAKDFTASKYDPQAWAKLFEEAGARYVVLTSKHHDGFSLYDTQANDWDVMSAGAGRDLISPLAKALKQEEIPFGLYFSQSQDWVAPGGGKRNPNRYKDGIANLPDGGGWDEAHKGSYDTYLQKTALSQVREILEKYRPAILWWDTPIDMTPERMQPFIDEMSKHPGLISNNRLSAGFNGDLATPEQNIPPRGFPGRDFEVCMTMNRTWGFRPNDTEWKSVGELLRHLSDIASKGGNFLLNVGPTPEGEIPPASVERLKAIGQWLKDYGVAIYGTQASPFPRRLPWGRVTRRSLPNGGEMLYAQIWTWPKDTRILLPDVTEAPVRAELLPKGPEVTARKTEAGVELLLPDAIPDEHINVVAVEFAKPVVVTTPAGPSPGADGVIVLDPLNADCNGALEGNIELKGHGAEATLTNWTDRRFFVEYVLITPKGGKWQVKAELSANEPTVLLAGLPKKGVKNQIAPTDGWKTLDLGTIELPAGENVIELRPGTKAWKPIELRRVTLTPVP